MLVVAGVPGGQVLVVAGVPGAQVLVVACVPGGQVLVVDEATSGLDGVAEAGCSSFVLALCQRLRVALVVVTHRLVSTTPAVDCVVVLQQGRVVASGLHDQLLKIRGANVYRELWASQQ